MPSSALSPARQAYLAYCDAQRHPTDRKALTADFFAPAAEINVVHPFNEIPGDALVDAFVEPLATAFKGLYRRHDILMAGEFEDAVWVTSMGYYVGKWVAPFAGLAPTNTLSFLRFGEFHRMDNGRAQESYIFLDLPELMAASSRWPIATGPGHAPGYRGLLPGPASNDGVLRSDPPESEAAKSYGLVTDMLKQLATPDEGWRPYWHDNMMWYGPAAFGSFVGIEEFASFQVPFESQFEGWSGGAAGNGMTRHFTRFGDGLYTCSGGWPSLTGVNVKPFFGEGPTNDRVFMRVCDWWRREGDLLVENWIFVDVPHVLLQFGRDVLAEAGEG